MTTMTQLSAIVSLGLLCGCGASGPRREESQRPLENQAPLVYDLHEWGVVSQSGQILDVFGGNPQRVARPHEMMVVEKPVVYLHHISGNRGTPISIEVGLEGGRLMEVWPLVPGHSVDETPEIVEQRPTAEESERIVRAPVIHWPPRVRFDVRFGAQCPVSPSLSSLCLTFPAPDGYCERAQLPLYVSSDADCLEVGAQSVPFLFYRGDMPSMLRALSLTAQTFTGGHIDGPLEGHQVSALEFETSDVTTAYHVDYLGGGALRLHVVRLQAGLTLVPLSSPDADLDDVDDVLEQFRADLVRQGLTPGEVTAFMRAWQEELFGGQATLGVGSVLLYWLPRAEIDRIAPLHVDPAPRSVRRVMLVRRSLE